MIATWRQLELSLRLHFRNPMAVVYNYLFPTLFLFAFWALYRSERVPLQAHIGELLTVTVLGGACFGLPTTLVSERERGLWRRYRLMPVSLAAIVASTLGARYVMLLLAGLLQITLAFAVGMPAPDRPLDLWVAFTCAAIAFMGLGLVIAMVADTVPEVQALGQSLFLPMLIVGGVAVPLGRLPEWAQTLALFLPGRYAVQAIQAAVTGRGVGGTLFDLTALLVIGAAACFAASRLFRWDAQDRFALRGQAGWIAAAIVPWLAIGTIAESRTAAPTTDTAGVSVTEITRPPTHQPPRSPTQEERARGTELARDSMASERSKVVAPSVPPGRSESTPVEPEWAAVTVAEIENEIAFDRLPPDGAVVTPLARPGEPIDPMAEGLVAIVEANLDGWAPGRVPDQEQRTRNLLYVAGVVDLLQWPAEPYVPRLVFTKLQREIRRDDLVKILYWIAVYWARGDDSAIDQMTVLGIDAKPEDVDRIRNRASIYAVKLLGRLLGKLPD